jgi:hypothetical protein
VTQSTHTRRLGTAIACAIAAAAIAVPLAQASSFVTEHSTSQNRVDLRNAYGPPDPWQYRFVTKNSASQKRVDLRNAYGPPDPWQYRFVTENSASQNRLHPASPSPTGYRFITENSASQNRLPSTAAQNAAVPASPDGFDWIAAAIGAAGTLTLALLTTAALLGARRTRGHVAPAG